MGIVLVGGFVCDDVRYQSYCMIFHKLSICRVFLLYELVYGRPDLIAAQFLYIRDNQQFSLAGDFSCGMSVVLYWTKCVDTIHREYSLGCEFSCDDSSFRGCYNFVSRFHTCKAAHRCK